MKQRFSIGCDPEFIMRKKDGGKLISAIPYIEGTKWMPQQLPKGGNVQRDNVALEIATDPADSCEGFVNNVACTLTEAIKCIPEEMEIIAEPSANFDLDQLEHEEAKMFGCEPDFDAWEMAQNPRPRADDCTFRSFGAHIHVGTNGKDGNEFLLHLEGKCNVVKGMDCVHALISTVLDCGEAAIARRRLYGKPGSHRPKQYGVEYRVLSNYWLKSPVTVMLMYHLTSDVLDIVRENKINDLIDELGESDVKKVIMEGDVKTAMKMLDASVLPRLSKDSIYYFNEALSKIKANDMDLYKEWGI